MDGIKVAVAADGAQVLPHFGRCQGYVVASLADGRILSRQTVPNPGHEPGALPRLMHELGVQCLITGGIGPRAIHMLAEMGIQTVAGVSGSVDDALRRFPAGELESADNPCEH